MQTVTFSLLFAILSIATLRPVSGAPPKTRAFGTGNAQWGSSIFDPRQTVSPVQDKKEDKKAPSKTGIEWNVAPANVIIYLDGKKIGDAGSVKFTETKPGKHGVRLTKGDDETEMEVKVNKGEVLKFEFEFTDG